MSSDWCVTVSTPLNHDSVYQCPSGSGLVLPLAQTCGWIAQGPMMFSAGSERILRPDSSMGSSSRAAPNAAAWGCSISGCSLLGLHHAETHNAAS